MRYCKNCGIRILDEAEICPMCSSVLSKVDLDDWPDTFKDPYPDVMKKRQFIQDLRKTFLIILVQWKFFLLILSIRAL